ncbi:MAG: hypothetical protein KDA58_15140 [Planctomycetaceae bacterium]|nr:hypothetical protein [Planctomycetaceae bacterium]
MRHVLLICGCLILCCGLGPIGSQADDAATTPVKKPAAEPQERRGPLPFYYGKLGMSDEQKEKAYAVQESYDKKLDELKKQMKALLAERDQKLNELLTDGQKLRLEELLVEAKKKAGPKGEKVDKNDPAAE